MTPAALPANILDLNFAARAGFRLNLARFLRDLKAEDSPDCDCETDSREEDDPDLD
jgi:hypothetical protein